MTPQEWIDFARTIGVPVAILLVVLWYIGKYALPKMLERQDTTTDQFTKALVKQNEDMRADRKADRDIFTTALEKQSAAHATEVKSMLDRNQVAFGELFDGNRAIVGAISGVKEDVATCKATLNNMTQVQFREQP